ncbi:MAG: TIGR00159 family protein [Verrucomicrobia bacterium]|nr:TIGR00159 family protein [Verrucomicrobiota bacterium]
MNWTPIKEHWRDGVEILLLAVVIYYAYNFLRRTRGAPIVNGLLVLLALAFVTAALKLEVLSWLLSAVLTLSALAAVVIFQPELRKLLAELGTQRLFVTAREQREKIEVIIQTVERLADVRIGALIAIEQKIDLQNAVESSIVVDCESTPEMLETIFFPNNAIHDGGVVIKNGRILRAACIFPLTQRPDLSKSLGTRHRAAIGLAEETDALVVVVSEETGQLSYAHNGQFTKNVTVEALRSFLTAELIPQGRPQNVLEWLRSHVEAWLKERPAPAPPHSDPGPFTAAKSARPTAAPPSVPPAKATAKP